MYIFYCFCLLYTVAVARVTIVDPPELFQTFTAPHLRSFSTNDEFNVESQLLVPTDFNYCGGNVKANEDFLDKIILLDLRGSILSQIL